MAYASILPVIQNFIDELPPLLPPFSREDKQQTLMRQVMYFDGPVPHETLIDMVNLENGIHSIRGFEIGGGA